MATQLDLADAHLIGFKLGKWKFDGIIELIESMGMTKTNMIQTLRKWKNTSKINNWVQ
jgi:hypothetical protein